ncbi:hypothetical protein T07_9199 [Trichinella nelsoni]|uniref:DUF2970 domain-containing protein n=1 Tax=Trichinella nelsoni TaxID=6336 RepID=A0A0V0RVA6_9BILA|nr:hypothetical protein T07_9199 [Trichinella nelsoni]
MITAYAKALLNFHVELAKTNWFFSRKKIMPTKSTTFVVLLVLVISSFVILTIEVLKLCLLKI